MQYDIFKKVLSLFLIICIISQRKIYGIVMFHILLISYYGKELGYQLLDIKNETFCQQFSYSIQLVLSAILAFKI